MIVQTRENKDLVIPKSLGNFVTEGSGGGITPEEAAEIASAVTEEAISEYDTELQVDLEEIRDAVSGNSEDISTLSGVTETISQQIGSLSGLTDDIAAISGQTTANTQNIGILSGATVAIEQSLGNYATTADTKAIQDSLANYATTADTKAIQDGLDIYATTATTDGLSTDITALSGVSSALTASVSALTANDNIAFFNLIKDYGNSNEELARLYDDMDAANTAGKTVVALSNFATGDTTSAAVFATFSKDMNGGFYGAGSGVHYNGTTYIAARAVPIFRRDDYYNVIKKDGHFYFSDMGTIVPYTLPTASSSTKGGIKVGSGLTMSGDFMSIKAGDGLGFSGDTLVVSGGTGGGPTNYYLNDMSQQELADLYDMIAELTEYDNDSSNIPYIFENYRFFAHTADVDGQQCVQLFFSNWEEQDGDYQLWIGGMLPTKASYPVNIHRTIAIILSDGTLQMSDSDLANIDDAANDFQIRINSNGYIDSGVLDNFSNLAKFNRFVFVYQDENITNNYCAAPLKYFYRKNETVGGEDKLVEYIGVEININGTWYKGDWHFAEFEWDEWNAPDTWTTI